MGLEILYLRGQGLECLYHLRLPFSSSAHFPLSPLPTHNSCSPLVGQQLTAAMWTVLSVLVEGAWVPIGVLSVGWLPFESRASCSGRENQAVAQVQVGGGSERNESMELGGIEGHQVVWTADHLQKSGPERSLNCIGEGQYNSQKCLHSFQQLDIQLGGEDTSSLDQHRPHDRRNEDSSDISRDLQTLCILPIRAHLGLSL